MQNTSKIPNIPNTLVKNFFIAGVNQKTLATQILEKKGFAIPPEVLFTMYQSKERVNNYLQFVFPEKVAVEYSSQEPKFYSFMTTDQEGFNTFIHVLIFYEEINEAEISSKDFDIMTEILRKQHQNKKNTARNRFTKNTKGLSREGTTNSANRNNNSSVSRDGSNITNGNSNHLSEVNNTLFQQHRKKLQEIIKQRNDKTHQLNCDELSTLQEVVEVNKKSNIASQIPKTPHSKVNILLSSSGAEHEQKQIQHKMKDQKKKEQITKLLQDLQIGAGMGAPPPGALPSNQSASQSDQRAFSYILSDQQLYTPHQRSQIRIPSSNLDEKAQASPKFGSGHIEAALTNENYFQNSHANPEKQPQEARQSSKSRALRTRPKSNAFKIKDINKIREHLNSEEGTYDEKYQIGQGNPFRLQIEPKAYDDYYGQQKQKNSQQNYKTSGNNFEDPYNYCHINNKMDQANQIDEMSADENFDDEFIDQNDQFLGRNTCNFGGRRLSQAMESSDQEDQLEQLYEKKRYVPVAICLETETEYHDVFRKILLTLFDEIRTPDNVLNNQIFENRKLAFAELVAHIAFLRTIPAPPFNANYNIYMFNKMFQISEGSLEQLPNRNSYAIKILFDVLDVKSIFYCWKALLFDKSVILVSSQYSLQFYVAEGLKQLLFPLTWQNTYIQPGNENLAGHCDGPIVCLYGSNSMVNGFDFFDGMSPEMVVVDIDACYTNCIDLPCVPDETMYIRILNTLKNSRINQYDKAYPDTHIPESEDFVNQVRETFFGLLKPFLSKVENYIDKSIDPSQAYFQNYFNSAGYLDEYSDYGETHYQFAKSLLQSSQFVHFCDDYFNDELNNFKLMKEILKSRGEIQTEQSAAPVESLTNNKNSPFSPDKRNLFKRRSNVHQDQIRNGQSPMFQSVNTDDILNGPIGKYWPQGEPLTFNFRMPMDNQRFMLFEKILFMIEESIEKREKEVSRETNEQILQKKDGLMYDKILKDIKKLYPIKLKGLHNKFKDQNGKLQSQNQRRLQHLRAQDSTKHSNQSTNPTANMLTAIQKLPTFFKNYDVRKGDQHRPSLDSAHISIESNQYQSRALQHRGSVRVTGITNLLTKQHTHLSSKKLPQFERDKSNNRLQLDIMSQSQDDFAGTSTNLNNNSFIELEQQRINFCKKRISRLMYGTQGLMTFLHHLFGLLSDTQMRQVNYYFAMQNEIEKLMKDEKDKSQKMRENRQNHPILEVNEDDLSPSHKGVSMHSRDRTKTIQQNFQFKNQVIDNQQSPKLNMQINSPKSNTSALIDQGFGSQAKFMRRFTNFKQSVLTSQGALPSIKSDESRVFKDLSQWLNVDQWQTNCFQIKRSHQFITFKMKLIETFECPEEGYSRIWNDLLKFPAQDDNFFPHTKFLHIWEQLTRSQQEEQFMKIGQKQDRPWIKNICQSFLKQNYSLTSDGFKASISVTASNNNSSAQLKKLANDENIFSNVCVYKNWVDKKKELQRERDLSSQRNKNNTPRKNFEEVQTLSTQQRQAHGQSNRLVVPKTTLDKSKQSKDKRNTKVTDLIKQKLEKRMIDKKSSDGSNDSSTSVSKTFTDPNFRDNSIMTKGTSLSGGINTPSSDNAALSSKNGENLSILYDYDFSRKTQKEQINSLYQKMQNPENVSQNLMHKIIDFWRKNCSFIEKKGYFKEKEITRIQQELIYFQKYFDYLSNHQPELVSDLEKQVFFLNLYNFLILYNLALNMLSNPDGIERIVNFSMWQAFQLSCKVNICGHKVNAFEIQHSVLRYSQDLPKMSAFILQSPKAEFNCPQFQVKDPEPLMCFGFFLPLKRVSRLKVFDVKNYQSQLKQRAEEFLLKKLRFKKDSSYISLPRILRLYEKDFNQDSHIQLLRYLEDNVFQSYGITQLSQFLNEFDRTQRKDDSLIFEFREFCWQFQPQRMTKLFSIKEDQSKFNEILEKRNPSPTPRLLQEISFKSCPYISFRFLNLIVLFNQFFSIIVGCILILELYDQEQYSVFIFGYFIAECCGFGIALLAFRLAPRLLVMGRTQRKWTLWIVYWLQMITFICHFLVSVAMLFNYQFLATYIAYNQRDYLVGLDSFKNVMIYVCFTTLILGLDVYLTIYFRKFLGCQQIRVEQARKNSGEVNLRSLDQYQKEVYSIYQKLEGKDLRDISETRKLNHKK